MSEMISRVAVALCEEKLWLGAFEQETEGNQQAWRAAARSAIEAMREPTDAMVKAAGGPVINLERADDPSYEPQLVWEDMIDEALK